MIENNLYSRCYTSKRRTIEINEIYHIVIFPCVNSFSVVKSKQCTPTGQDGFVLVQSGGRKYTGFIFETGNNTSHYYSSRKKLSSNIDAFDVCSKAADLLSQKQNEDIESDYKRAKENIPSNDNSLNSSGVYLFIYKHPFLRNYQ